MTTAPKHHTEALRHLRHLFAELHCGPYAVADPSAFANYLELETGVQQDGMEFLKLLLTLLEGKLAGSPQESMLRRLYCGRLSFSTTCQVIQWRRGRGMLYRGRERLAGPPLAPFRL